MDTNVKKFKNSALTKVICVVLCIVTFAFASGLTAAGVLSIIYVNDEGGAEQWSQSNTFQRVFINDLDRSLSNLTAANQKKLADEFVKKQKNAIIARAYDIFCSEYDKAIREAAAYGFDLEDYLADYHGEYSYQTVVTLNNIAKYNDICFNVTLPPETTPQTALALIAEQFDPEKIEYWENARYFGSVNDGFSFSLKNADFDKPGVSESKVYASSVYYVLRNGAVQSKGLSGEVIRRISSSLKYFGISEKNLTLEICLDVPEISGFKSLIENYGNSYASLKFYHQRATGFYDNLTRNLIIAVIMLVATFCLGIQYLTCAGKKDADGKTKRAFIDYVPIELHLAASVGVGVLLTFFWFHITELNFDVVSPTAVYAGMLLLVFYQLLLLEFSASVSRCITADRKFYKNFLLFWVGLGLYKTAVLFAKFFITHFEKVKNSFKRTASAFKYKTGSFKRNVITLTVLYFLANIALAGFIFLLLCYGATLPAILLAIADIAANIYIVKKICDYVKNLDKIITAVSQGESSEVNGNELPASLALLADGINSQNARLQTAVAKAVKDERLRAELITNVSHDLKTPLTSIITYVDLLSHCDIGDGRAHEYLQVLTDKSGKLKRLIDDLIEASKVTSGNVSVNPAPMNLSELCLQSTVDAQADFEKAGLELVIKQGQKPVTVFADGSKSFRIIENLLSNARKYSAKASRVYVSVYRDGGMGVFEIKNVSSQPLDITPEELTERFVRGDKSRSLDGNGLGLSIAKELCKLQNGELELTIDGDLFKARVKLPLS